MESKENEGKGGFVGMMECERVGSEMCVACERWSWQRVVEERSVGGGRSEPARRMIRAPHDLITFTFGGRLERGGTSPTRSSTASPGNTKFG